MFWFSEKCGWAEGGTLVVTDRVRLAEPLNPLTLEIVTVTKPVAFSATVIVGVGVDT